MVFETVRNYSFYFITRFIEGEKKHTVTHTINGILTYIYHKKSTIHVGKYTSPMVGIGN